MQNVRDALARAAALVDRQQFAAAEEIAGQIVRQLPDCAAALVLLGIVARKTHRAAEAVDWLRRATSCRPDDAAIRCELGRALADGRRFDEAVVEFRRAIELNPNGAGACLNLGAVLGQLDQPEAAIAWCRRAVELAPNDPIAQFNRGNVARSLGLLDEATAALEMALRLAPDFAAAHWNCGYCYLLAGDFARGWREHEWRASAGEVALDNYPQPRWTGESLEGRTILVHGEQGIGDEILFGSCLPELILRAGHCAIVCDPRLAPLFERSFPQATVHGFARRQDRQGMPLAQRIDVQIPIGSLPLYLRTTRNSFPQRERFLTADAAQVADWKNRFARLGPGLKIGISWRAGGQPGERRMRTTSLDLWRPLLSLPRARFVNLQYGDCVDELAAVKRDCGIEIHDWADADPLVNMDAFAAKVAALDLVVSVDNSTVHLSGALGVPTWVLLPQVPGWRWSIADERSVWYPSLRLFRQPRRGDWAAVFENVGQLLGRGSPGKAAEGFSNGKTVDGHPWAWGGADRDNQFVESPPEGATSTETGWAPTIRAAVDSYEQGDFATAEALCRRVLNHSPRHLQATNLLGALAGQTGRLDLAMRTLSRAAAIAGDDPIVLLNMAAALTDSGQFDRAIDAYRRVIERQPDLFDVHLGYAKALQAAGRHDEAITAVQQAVRIRPDQHKTFNLLGAWCLAADRLQEAEAALQAAVRIRPEYMAAYNNLGLALERQERLDEAEKCFARAVELDRNCAQAANNLAALRSKLGAPGTGSFFGSLRPECPPTLTPENVPVPLASLRRKKLPQA
jgi:tetratricopeptide (TPR) repeat protein